MSKSSLCTNCEHFKKYLIKGRTDKRCGYKNTSTRVVFYSDTDKVCICPFFSSKLLKKVYQTGNKNGGRVVVNHVGDYVVIEYFPFCYRMKMVESATGRESVIGAVVQEMGNYKDLFLKKIKKDKK